MKITVRVQVGTGTAEEDGAEQFSEVFVLEREQFTDASVGLSLTEAHTLLGSIQEAMICAQASAAVAEQGRCARCGRAHRHKDTRTITVRTLFGTLHLDSPRFMACRCRADAEGPATFSPLAAVLAGRHTPELVYLQARMAKSLQPPPPDPDPELSAETATKLIGGVSEDLGRLKWFLWHGNVFNALQTVEGIAIDLETLHPNGEPTKLLKAVREFDS